MTVAVSGSSVTLYAIGAGNAVVRVFASDPGGLSVYHDFTVRVTAEEEPDDFDDVSLNDFNVTIPSSCSRRIQLCVHDWACEDGDEVSVSVNGVEVLRTELFNEPKCVEAAVQEGANTVRLFAINDSGYKCGGGCGSSCSPGDPSTFSKENSGEITITGHQQTQRWEHRGGTGSSANLNVTIGPPDSCPSTSGQPISSSSFGAVAFDLLEGCGSAFGFALDYSTEQAALQAAIGSCQDGGGSGTECTDYSTAYIQCAAIAYGDSQTSCYMGAGFGSSAGTARQDALTDCRNEPGGFNCRILTSDDGDSAFCN